MALVIEDGTAQVFGAESYVTVAEADTYHANPVKHRMDRDRRRQRGGSSAGGRIPGWPLPEPVERNT